MRTLSVKEHDFVFGGDGDASEVCESIGDISGATLAAAAGAYFSGTVVGAAGAAATGYEVGESAGEAACAYVSNAISSGIDALALGALYGSHGPLPVFSPYIIDTP